MLAPLHPRVVIRANIDLTATNMSSFFFDRGMCGEKVSAKGKRKGSGEVAAVTEVIRTGAKSSAVAERDLASSMGMMLVLMIVLGWLFG